MTAKTSAITCLMVITIVTASQAEFKVQVRRNVMMKTRDGVSLATDLYIPRRPAGKQCPAILIRTPYNKAGLNGIGQRFAKKGIAVVGQDVRGRYASGGTFYIYTREGKDGFDAVEWTARQPWCNGKVGTWGGSYLAATQQAAAVEKPPHLTTMFVVVGTSNYSEDGAGRGGAFALLHNMVYAFKLASTSKEARANPVAATALRKAVADLPHWILANPLKEQSPLRHATAYQRWYADWREHSTYDSYWKQNGYNFEEYHPSYPSVPICFVGGWYDIFKRGTLRSFTGLASKHEQTRLIVGPWPHSTGGTFAGNVDFGAQAKRSIIREAEVWFDRHLLGKVAKKRPRVEYFVMEGATATKNKAGRLQSGGRWRSADRWPPSGYAPTRFYLAGKGQLITAPGADARKVYTFDPANPVPSIGGNIDSGKQLVPRGAQNQVPKANSPFNFSGSPLPLSARSDVLSFQTQPLSRPVEVAGRIRVDLWVSSTGIDTDFTAKLIDVYPPSKDYPNGYAMNLEDGILRMRFRRSREKEVFMEPGKIYKVSIDLWSTANRFAKGHRIRLDISSSSFPMYDVNPNTGEAIGKHTHLRKVRNTIYVGKKRPSHLLLPVK